MGWFGLTCVTSFSVFTAGKTLKNCLWMNSRPQDYIDRYSEKKLHSPRSRRYRISSKYPSVFLERHSYQARLKEKREGNYRRGARVGRPQRLYGSDCYSIRIDVGFLPMRLRAESLIESARGTRNHSDLFPSRIEARVARNSARAHTPLTPREREIMQWVAAGKTDDGIGEILVLGTSTVASHIENAKRKQGPGTRERTVFHQNATYFEIEGEKCCVLWIPVDPVTLESGTMLYVRGSHRDGKLYQPNVFFAQTPLPGLKDGDPLSGPDFPVVWTRHAQKAA